MRAVHVVIAPDCFTGTLTATQAAEAMAAGWHDTAPQDTLTLLPLSDGGPGFLDVLAGVLDGDTVGGTVTAFNLFARDEASGAWKLVAHHGSPVAQRE